MVESIRCLKKAGLDLLSQEEPHRQRLLDYIIQAMSNALLGVPCFFQTGARS